MQGDGDLTIKLNDSSRDETGLVANAFNQFLSALCNYDWQSEQPSQRVGSSAESALFAMQRTSENVEKQRNDIESIATAITEMNNTTQNVASSSAEASAVTNEVKSKVLEESKKRLRPKR